MLKTNTLLLLTLSLAGCAHFEYNVLKVKSGGSQGNGVILSSDTLLTVKHLVKDPLDVKIWYWRDNRWRKNKGYWIRAEVVREIPTRGFEPLVLLRVPGYKKNPGFFDWKGFKKKDTYKLGINTSPYKIITGRRSFLWGKECIRPGDSGSPVVNEKGNLVGLISATSKEGEEECPVCFISHGKENTIYTRIPISLKAITTRDPVEALGD